MPKFIELTKTDGRKVLINVDRISYIEPKDMSAATRAFGEEAQDGTLIAVGDSVFQIRETYDQILAYPYWDSVHTVTGEDI